MKIDDVPQDNCRYYEGQHKLIYAKNQDGSYAGVQSSGWDVEEAATMDAVDEYGRLANEALKDVHDGKASPLLYHMYDKRMDLPFLAQASGQLQWFVKRHFKTKNFTKLSNKKLQNYADLFGISVEEIKRVPVRAD